MLDALGAPAERRQPPAAARRACVDQGPGRPAEPARERTACWRVGQRDRAGLALEDGPALVTAEDRGESADAEEHSAARGERLPDRARQRGRQRLALGDAARVGDADDRPRRGRRAVESHPAAVALPPQLHARCGAGEQRAQPVPTRAFERDVPRVHARRARRLVGRLVLVDQRDRRARGQRRQEGRPCAHRQRGLASGERVPGLRPLGVGHAGIQTHDVAELAQALRPAGCAFDVGGEHERRRPSTGDALDQPRLPSSADEELGRRWVATLRLCARAWHRRGRRGRHEGETRGAQARRAVGGDPAYQVERGVVEHGGRLDRAQNRLQLLAVVRSDVDDHADAGRPAQRGQHALASRDRQALGDSIRERMGDRSVERDVRDHVTSFGGGRTPGGRV